MLFSGRKKNSDTFSDEVADMVGIIVQIKDYGRGIKKRSTGMIVEE